MHKVTEVVQEQWPRLQGSAEKQEGMREMMQQLTQATAEKTWLETGSSREVFICPPPPEVTWIPRKGSVGGQKGSASTSAVFPISSSCLWPSAVLGGEPRSHPKATNTALTYIPPTCFLISATCVSHIFYKSLLSLSIPCPVPDYK